MKYNNYRKLGNTSKEIFPIGLGAMSFTDFYGNCEEYQSAEVLKTCLDLGVNHIDTANVYGMGLSEERIGNFLSRLCIILLYTIVNVLLVRFQI